MKSQPHTSILRHPRGTVVAHRGGGRGSFILAWFPLLSAVGFVIFSAVVLLAGVRERARYEAFKETLRSVPVSVQLVRPSLSQESVDLAVALYSIDVESFVEWPLWDASLADRGLTSGATLDLRKSVTVGPAAFTSWSVLGSTLGHEIEIHCRQSFASILFLDKVARVAQSAKAFWSENRALASSRMGETWEPFGTWKAERSAYEYEIDSALRFGLSVEEVASIRQVMDYYYPLHVR